MLEPGGYSVCKPLGILFMKHAQNVRLKAIVLFQFYQFAGKSLSEYADNMIAFFTENNLIYPNQSGFKQGDFCINQLLSINHDILSTFNIRLENTDIPGHFKSA